MGCSPTVRRSADDVGGSMAPLGATTERLTHVSLCVGDPDPLDLANTSRPKTVPFALVCMQAARVVGDGAGVLQRADALSLW